MAFDIYGYYKNHIGLTRPETCPSDEYTALIVELQNVSSHQDSPEFEKLKTALDEKVTIYKLKY